MMRTGKPMLNFAVGPVQSGEEVLAIGAESTPYFRTQEFSDIMLENEEMIMEFAGVGDEGRAVFITGSGTASMEAVIVNFFDPKKDRILVINGGGFGQRFATLCHIHKLEYTELKLDMGQAIEQNMLEEYSDGKYTALLVNIHETSTGVHYDLDMISKFCHDNGIFLVVDAVSSFLADPIDMESGHIDVMITGSQKALACPPGISIIAMRKAALRRLDEQPVRCMYLDLKDALKNAERGQTPFTPAVTILLQINARLKEIKKQGGVESEIARISGLAEYFRERINELPLEIFTKEMSNALTPVHPLKGSALDVFNHLKDEYGIWICPNGGELSNTLFRVGHIGALTREDYDELIDALYDLERRGII